MQEKPVNLANDLLDTFAQTYPEVKVSSGTVLFLLFICSEAEILHRGGAVFYTSIMAQGGTCIFAGDSHKRIDEVAAEAQKRIGCQVFKRKKFYRKSGYQQVTRNCIFAPYWSARLHPRCNDLNQAK